MDQTGATPGLPFMKMHGAGNDFVVIDSRGRGAAVTPALARALGDRNRGVGFDQLAEIRDDATADSRWISGTMMAAGPRLWQCHALCQ